jgi:hypothetical protein
LAAAKTLAEALLAVQQAVPKLEKDKQNPHFKNDYVTLDALLSTALPVLQANDVLLSQEPSFVDSSEGPVATLVTRLTHVPTGEAEASVMLLTLDKATPQGQGSAITYARRYAIGAILGLITETDDDGNSASSRGPKKDPTESELKKKTFDIAKVGLDKAKPTAAEVAKFFGIQASELSDKATLQRLLEEHGAA